MLTTWWAIVLYGGVMMKATIEIVGNYVEGTQEGALLSNWHINGTEASEGYTPDELREIAKENGTYSTIEGKIVDGKIRGIRYYDELE